METFILTCQKLRKIRPIEATATCIEIFVSDFIEMLTEHNCPPSVAFERGRMHKHNVFRYSKVVPNLFRMTTHLIKRLQNLATQ